MRCSILLALPLLLLTACPVPVDGSDDELGDDESDTATGDTESETGDTETGSESSECASACADQVACGDWPADELDACTSDCEISLVGYTLVFGSECAEAKHAAWLCSVADACENELPTEACDPLAMTAMLACKETIIPELDALCECLAQDVPPEPSDPVTPKESCVIYTAEVLIEALAFSQACFDAYPPAYQCAADSCANPECASEPAPESCSCSAIEQDVVEACS